MEGRIGRARQHGIEVGQLTCRARLRLLRIDLLQAEDVGVQARQLGLQGRSARLDGQGVAAPPAQILDVEGRQPNAHRDAPFDPKP